MSVIYKITNKINNKIYIGFTTKTTEKRFKIHLNCINNKQYKNSLLYKAIRKYGFENFKSETIIEGNFNLQLLSELEKHYIQLYNTFNPKIGYNLNKGGLGGNTYIRTKEIKEKISNSLKGHSYNKGTLKSENHKIKVSEALKRLKEAGVRWSTCKYVYQYDLNGELIKKFNSLNEASKVLNLDRTTLLNISKGKTKNPRCGFKFKISY